MCKSGFYPCILWFLSLLPFPLKLLAFKESLLQHQALGNEFTNWGWFSRSACMLSVCVDVFQRVFLIYKEACNWDKITNYQIFRGCFSSWREESWQNTLSLLEWHRGLCEGKEGKFLYTNKHQCSAPGLQCHWNAQPHCLMVDFMHTQWFMQGRFLSTNKQPYVLICLNLEERKGVERTKLRSQCERAQHISTTWRLQQLQGQNRTCCVAQSLSQQCKYTRNKRHHSLKLQLISESQERLLTWYMSDWRRNTASN